MRLRARDTTKPTIEVHAPQNEFYSFVDIHCIHTTLWRWGRGEGEEIGRRMVASIGMIMIIPAVLRLPDCRMKTLCQPLLIEAKKTLINSCGKALTSVNM